MNFGNFLWGDAGYSEGLGLGLLRWGANYNSLHNSPIWREYAAQAKSAEYSILYMVHT
ncbi:hypothetical protein [Mucilaginibacter sp.]|uniref:hypothetical protein n=1 Tax=Mucilaginibacter sp. TaxID=1882438 RepID=UPI0025F85155|nr:hypothetical protein [Mucilaginibacter sp.]